MKFTIINILSIVVLGSCMASLTSCEISLSEEVYFPEHEVLVVHSFISPQDTGVLVMVAKSNSIMSEDDTPLNNLLVEDADVYISDGVLTKKLDFIVLDTAERTLGRDSAIYWPIGAYYAPADMFPVKAGKTYTLEVSTPDGLSASAETTVPKDFSVTDFAFTTERVPRNLEYCPINMNTCETRSVMVNDAVLSWEEDSEENNFYYLKYPKIVPRYKILPDSTFEFGWLLGYFETKNISDKNAKGEKLQIRSTVGVIVDGVTRNNASSFIVNFEKRNEELYVYYDSWERYHRYNDNGMLPFYDPPIMYTNIEGGRGVFGAYNRKELAFLF